MKRLAGRSVSALTLFTVISACGSTGTKPVTPTTAGGTTPTAVASTLAGQPVSTIAGSKDTIVVGTIAGASGGAVKEVGAMKGAIAQIIVEGEIRDPSDGAVGFSGSGSGFIIDADGTIVTNSHVVTGAGAISVLVGGDKSNVIPAKVLGISECSDLAVIKLSAPGPYPFLKWSTKPIEPPLEVYAAGFPLGDPEYTITRGVVSKAKAFGETNWASVPHVIEHDANIQPGNSGGPLVDKDGAVVGINYATDAVETGTSQFFAIANDLAKPTIQSLMKGDQESIGVNGRAFVNKDAGLAGVYVRGVAPGGPASKAEVKPGDVITTLNGVDMGGGTYGQYCKVLRSARDGAPISIRVVRLDSQEVLEGELNGKPLKPVFSFAQKAGADVKGNTGTTTLSGQYTRLTDSTGKLSVEVPVEWTETNLEPTDISGNSSPTIIASPDLKKFQGSGFQGSGEQLILLEKAGVGKVDKDQLLDGLEKDNAKSCEKGERSDFKDDRYTGRYVIFKCGDVVDVVAILSPVGNNDQAIILLAQAETEADLAAADRMLSSFEAK
jgi:serine protease Do